MKRIVACVLVCVLIFGAAGCASYNYDGWNDLAIDSCGTLKIPPNWQTYIVDDLLYIVDENKKPVMIQTHSHAGIEDGDFGEVESNAFFEEVRCLKFVSGEVFSNGAFYGRVTVEKNGMQSQQYILEFEGATRVSIVVWDDTIEDELVKKIAKSFVSS